MTMHERDSPARSGGWGAEDEGYRRRPRLRVSRGSARPASDWGISRRPVTVALQFSACRRVLSSTDAVMSKGGRPKNTGKIAAVGVSVPLWVLASLQEPVCYPSRPCNPTHGAEVSARH